MEHKKIEIIRQLIPANQELATLWEEHLAFERQLETLNDALYLSTTEQMERKRIQKLKLAGRDRIEAILSECREREGAA